MYTCMYVDVNVCSLVYEMVVHSPYQVSDCLLQRCLFIYFTKVLLLDGRRLSVHIISESPISKMSSMSEKNVWVVYMEKNKLHFLH